MYRGKRVKNLVKRPVLLLVSLLMLLSVSLAGTLAYLATGTDAVTNTFAVAPMSNLVEEDFDGTVKEDVTIRNTAKKAAYIRAAVVVTWAEVDTAGNATGNLYAGNPAEGTDYSITWTMDGWIRGEDGYYYCTTPVAAGGETGVLFTECRQLQAAPSGYRLSVEIMGQSVQADGVDSEGRHAVETVWPVTVDETDGTLRMNS